jgi:hypothetical protein
LLKKLHDGFGQLRERTQRFAEVHYQISSEDLPSYHDKEGCFRFQPALCRDPQYDALNPALLSVDHSASTDMITEETNEVEGNWVDADDRSNHEEQDNASQEINSLVLFVQLDRRKRVAEELTTGTHYSRDT